MRPSPLTLLGLIGMLALASAGSLVWLVLSQPVAVADAVSSGQYEPLLAVLAEGVGDLFRTLARLL